MDIKSLIIIIAAIINSFLGGVVLLKNSKNRSNRWFGYFVLSLVAWSAAMVFYRSAESIEKSNFWVLWLYEIALFIPITFLFFTFFFPDGKQEVKKGYLWLLWLPTTILAVLTYIPDFIVSGVNIPTTGEKIINWGPYYLIYNLYFVVYFSILFIVLFRKFFKSQGVLRTQIKFILFGTFVPSILANVSNLLLPTFGIFYFNWVGQVLTIAMVLFVVYAIAKHHLLNIKVIATEIFAALIPLTLLVDAFFSTTRTEVFFKGGLFLFVSFFSVLLVRSVIKEVKTKERIEKLARYLRAANAELQKVDKAKSEFISIASHQLRTPLASIKGFLSMILDGDYGKISDEIRDKTEKALQSNERLIRLVNDLLSVSRMEEGRMKYEWEKVDLSEMVQSLFDEMQIQAQSKSIELVLEGKEAGLLVKADETKLRQVLLNLIDNAIKYTEKGKVMISLAREGDVATFRVKDTGIGIPKEDLPKLFEKFSRGDRSPKIWTEGIGLGLYVARMIIEQHQGTISADSEGEGKGSTFFVKIPVLNEGRKNLKF